MDFIDGAADTVGGGKEATISSQNEPEPSYSFDKLFAVLQSLRDENGSLVIPASHPDLAQVVDSLANVRIEELVERRWNEHYKALEEFNTTHGSCDVPPRHPLGVWVEIQREHYRLYDEQKPNPLSPSRNQRLKDIGLVISYSNKWEMRFEQLRRWKQANGHTDVPISTPQLGIWVLNQRFNLTEMPQERIDALDNIGFIWNYSTKTTDDKKWEAKFALLKDYIAEHGTPNVPKSNEPLSCWVRKQRYEYSKFRNKKKAHINRQRIEKLNEVGFQFRLRGDLIPWGVHFEELKQYKAEHDNFVIPRNHPRLGSWSVYQKAQYKHFAEGKKSTLDQFKVEKLISIGFLESEAAEPLDLRTTLTNTTSNL